MWKIMVEVTLGLTVKMGYYMWWFLARDSLVGCWLEKWLSVCRQRSGIEQDAILWFSGLEWLLLQSSSKDHARSVSFNHNSVPYRG